MSQKEQIIGGGPWTFENENPIPVGGEYKINFWDKTYNGSKGYFRDYLPLTSMQVSNLSSSEAVIVTLNNNGRYHIPPNTSEGLNNEQITSFSVENVGANQIDSGNIKVDVKKDAYNADRKAMDEKMNESSPAIQNIKKIANFLI